MGNEIDGLQSKAGKTIEGEVLRVEGDSYFVKKQDGKEVRLHTDKNTKKTGSINPGHRIGAKVNDHNQALSIAWPKELMPLMEMLGASADSTFESGRIGSMGQ